MTLDGAPQVSIVVACRNEAKCIRRFLDSLLAQDLTGISWEAVIADGMSDDGTPEILEEYSAKHPQLRILNNPGRIVSRGLNAAIRAARGSIILRMDAHSWYSESYCRLCLETLERTGADLAGGPIMARVEGVWASAITAAFHSRFATGGASRFRDLDYEGWVTTLPYGAFRRATLEKIGLFDETLVRNQDDELNIRLLRSGGRIWQNPAIVSWYSPRANVSKLFHQYFQYGFWQVPVIRKHRALSSWKKLVPAAFVIANGVSLGTVAVAALGSFSWLNAAITVWLALILSYLVACVFASALAARKSGWAVVPFLPVIFCVYHFSFGLGFVTGLLKAFFQQSAAFSTEADSALTRLTR
jgi:succinoglycan biosynthesis protein ExoA